MKKHLVLASALVLAGLSTTAAAADSNWFVRGEAGTSRLDTGDESGNDQAFSARAGYWFNQNFAIEGLYTNYGQDSGSGVSAKIDGFGLGVVGKKSFGANDTGFFIDGRAGVVRTRTKVSISGLGSASDKSTNGYLGAGAGYDFSANFGVSLNLDYTRIDAFGVNGNVKTATIGLEYRF